MRELVFAMGTSLCLVTGTAYALQTEGTVERIDRIAGTITVEGGIFSVSSDALETLNEGEVSIRYKRGGTDQDKWYGALHLDKLG